MELRTTDTRGVPDDAALVDSAGQEAKALAAENAALREELQSLRVRLGVAQQQVSQLKNRIKQLTGR